MNRSGRLHDLCLRGLDRLLAGRPDLRADASTRLERELAGLDCAGWSATMVAAADLAAHARDQGVGVGPGRGAVTGSLVSFLAGVTDVNPLDHGLLFERFLATCYGQGASIALEVEARGHPILLGIRDSAAIERVRILPSDALDALFGAARRSIPARRAEDVFGLMSLADPEVLRLDRRRASRGIPHVASSGRSGGSQHGRPGAVVQ